MSEAGQVASLDVALAHATRLLASEPELAAEQAREIIAVVGEHPMALLVLGASHTARGAPEQAVAVLAPVAAAQPQWAMAQWELGRALSALGRSDAATAALRRAVSLKPDLPGAWLMLADQLALAGDATAASAAYSSHVRYSTRDPDLLAAATALCEDRIPDAELLLRAHLKKSPTDVAAIRMLAELAARLGRDDDAEALLARCIALAPDFDAARHHHALVLNRANRAAEALAEVECLLRKDPRNPAYRNLKAVILCRTGDYLPAIDIYDALLAQYPDHARIWLSYGHALKTAGRQEQAIAAYRRSSALEPGFGDAWWSLANLKTFRFSADDVRAMRAQLERADLGDEHRQHFAFALAKALEDAEEFEESFVHYQRGNSLRRMTSPYSADDTSVRTQRAKELYTADFYAQRAGAGASAPDPIFIVGLPRAGSTLIEQILSSHSQVEGTMELPELMTMTRALRRQSGADARTYHDAVAMLDAEQLRELGERYLERTRIHRKTSAPFFIDKMPNNFAHVGLIRLILPNARIIDARRHPMACCFSAFKQYFALGQTFTYDLVDLGRYYQDYVALMTHFDEVQPGRIHRVRYEQMVTDTGTQVRRLLDYCGLPFEEQCLRFFENERPVRTASSEQVRRPIFREGIDHWRHYEPWLGPLKQALGPVLDAYPETLQTPACSTRP
ncbi:tetratricopeptide repeat-containing sulfotransferase family protein [Cognatiluteimonas profundi]|uniref:tetratricopeptide repeat-containing sulfotransferase family protein n=1 Tax=Cognatiluteimonas profundi TaxID=2594501 RepID=UPI00131CEBEB|nr:tetratricopeptide repeat-containing sulfotransferase family protein [Lysobacter profundi]